MTKSELHGKLVAPVCALEEYCNSGRNLDPVVDVSTQLLRYVLNELEKDIKEES
jgi:hypothetical protein